VAKTTLKRLPSSVYWQGPSLWGIRSFSGAQVQYHRGLDRYYVRLTRHGGRAAERAVEHDDLISPNRHAGLVSPSDDFPKECSLSLTRSEAEYLAERIRLSPACSGSLLADLVAQRRRSDDVSFAWEHPHCAELPPKLREILDHAQNFSEVMHGAPLLYNLILAEQARWGEGIAKYRRGFAEWAKLLAVRSHVLAQLNRERFWELVRSVNPRITVADASRPRVRLEQLQGLFVDTSNVLARFAPIAIDEVLNEQENIRPSCLQRRHIERKYV
jgi:Family of unknown function (DUF6361)